MIKFAVFGIALFVCITFGAVKSFAYAQPKAKENVSVKKVKFKNRIEDYSAAVDFMSNYPLVDKNKIGVIGICGDGGYAVSAAQIETISPRPVLFIVGEKGDCTGIYKK